MTADLHIVDGEDAFAVECLTGHGFLVVYI